jgi:hypothetical protein
MSAFDPKRLLGSLSVERLLRYEGSQRIRRVTKVRYAALGC